MKDREGKRSLLACSNQALINLALTHEDKHFRTLPVRRLNAEDL